jgi:hypothetical protein
MSSRDATGAVAVNRLVGPVTWVHRYSSVLRAGWCDILGRNNSIIL